MSQTSRLVHTKVKQLKIKQKKPILKQFFKENNQNAKLKQNGPHLKKENENMNQLQISNGGLKKLRVITQIFKTNQLFDRSRKRHPRQHYPYLLNDFH